MNSSYSLFNLFFSEKMFEKISNSTNTYPQLHKHDDDDDESPFFQGQSWKDISAAEIKVFFAVLIYMRLHDSPQIDCYWQRELNHSPIHTPQLYITLLYFEQINTPYSGYQLPMSIMHSEMDNC